MNQLQVLIHRDPEKASEGSMTPRKVESVISFNRDTWAPKIFDTPSTVGNAWEVSVDISHIFPAELGGMLDHHPGSNLKLLVVAGCPCQSSRRLVATWHVPPLLPTYSESSNSPSLKHLNFTCRCYCLFFCRFFVNMAIFGSSKKFWGTSSWRASGSEPWPNNGGFAAGWGF